MNRLDNLGRIKRLFWAAWFVVILAKIALAVVLPITGDEAYFILWGMQPDWGFYDHPPMVGWWEALLLPFGNAPWLMRVPAIFANAVVAIALVAAVRPYDREKAHWVGLLYVLWPLNVIDIFITTDTPLLVFSVISGLLFARAIEHPKWTFYAAAGAFLGLAFLSKYFAVLLGLAYLVVVIAERRAASWRGFAILVAAALPFVAVNVYWNYGHCWTNILFNLYNRHDDGGASPWNPIIFLATQLYLATPFLLYAALKHRPGWREALANPPFRVYAMIFGVVMMLFAALSIRKVIGLHWVLWAYPFFFLLFAPLLSRLAFARAAQWMAAFSIVHLLIALAFISLPLQTWKHWSKYDGLVFNVRTAQVIAALQPYSHTFQSGADNYSAAAIASYYSGRHFLVFGEASSHARHDDIATDFRALNGKNIFVLRRSPPELGDYLPYFASVKVETFSIEGVTFYVVLGRGFNYTRYRDTILSRVRAKYYTIPRFLPQGGCYFCDRYFHAACPAR